MFIPTSRQAFEALQPHFNRVEFSYGQWGNPFTKLELNIEHQGREILFIKDQVSYFDLREAGIGFAVKFDPNSSDNWATQMKKIAWPQISLHLPPQLVIHIEPLPSSTTQSVREYDHSSFRLVYSGEFPGLHLPSVPIRVHNGWQSYFPRTGNDAATLSRVLINNLNYYDDVRCRTEQQDKIRNLNAYSKSEEKNIENDVLGYLNRLHRYFPELFASLPTA